MPPRIGIDARLIRAYGIGSYIRGLLRGLASLDAPEQYVVFARSEDRERIPAAFEFVRADLPSYSIQELPRMGRMIARARLDLFHAPHFTVPWTRVPVVATLYDAIPFHYKLRNPIAFAYITFMMQTAARRAQHILAISHAAKRDLVEALDCDPDRITVSHIGVDDAFFHTPAAPAMTSGPYFLFVGRVAVHKNVNTLVAALAIARKRIPSLRLVLAGGEHEARSAEGVVIPGFLPHDEMLALYRDAVAVVMPSFMEGFGLPPLEGMAMGTPAITSTAPALVEVTGDAALHVDPRNARDFADAMVRLVEDSALRATLAKRGRERAQAFTWRRCAEETRAVYLQSLPHA